MEKIRLVFLIGGLGYGGTEGQLVKLLRNIDSASFSCSVIVFNKDPDADFEEEIPGLGVELIRVPERCRSVVGRLAFIVKTLRRIKPHAVHSWTPHDNPYAGVGGFLAGVKTRWGSLRNSLASSGLKELNPLLRHLCLYSVARIVVNSMDIRNELLEGGYADARVVVIPNCIETSSNSPADLSEYGISSQNPVVGTVGNIRSVKNHSMFIETMARVIARHADARGVIVGQRVRQEPDMPEKLAAEIERHGLTGKVVLVGLRRDIPELLKRFSVFCLTSDSEGLPNALLEAMAAGCPVVATRVGGVAELVEPGKTGYLVAPGDSAGMAEHVMRLLRSSEEAAHIGRSATSHALQRFGAGEVTKKFENLYRAVERTRTGR